MNILPADNTINLLQTFLDVQSRRAEVIAGNIANADTPGYKAQELDFEEHLRDAARLAELPSPAARESVAASLKQPKLVEQETTVVGFDGNTVDVGREMSQLAQAGGSFNFGVKMLQSHLRLLRAAIREGR